MGENEKLLLRILEQNKDTEYGRKYGFANIHSIEEYQKKVPVSVYDDYAGYILRMSEDGEENLITSGKVVHYNKSSGTVGNPYGAGRKRTRRRLDQRTEYVHCGIHCRDPAREKRCYLWSFVSKNDR